MRQTTKDVAGLPFVARIASWSDVDTTIGVRAASPDRGNPERCVGRGLGSNFCFARTIGGHTTNATINAATVAWMRSIDVAVFSYTLTGVAIWDQSGMLWGDAPG